MIRPEWFRAGGSDSLEDVLMDMRLWAARQAEKHNISQDELITVLGSILTTGCSVERAIKRLSDDPVPHPPIRAKELGPVEFD